MARRLRARALTLASVLAFVAGLWILGGACRFALSSNPPPERVAAYRTVFYERSGLGGGCLLLAIVFLRLRGARPGETEAAGPGAGGPAS